MSPSEEKYAPGFANGVYSYKEAGAVVGVSSARIKRWADGYTYKRKYDLSFQEPVLQTNRSQKVLNFYELIELLFVREYGELGVSLQIVRATAQKLAPKFGPYPFANAELYVAGRELLSPVEDGIAVRPDIGQLVSDFADHKVKVRTTVDPAMGLVYAYRVPGHDLVTLNARVRMGEPTVGTRMIPTKAIYRLWQVEQALDPVRDYFSAEIEDVKAAIEFESKVKFCA